MNNIEVIKNNGNMITRVEVIDTTGRAYTNWDYDNVVQVHLQDNGRTLKVIINKKENIDKK